SKPTNSLTLPGGRNEPIAVAGAPALVEQSNVASFVPDAPQSFHAKLIAAVATESIGPTWKTVSVVSAPPAVVTITGASCAPAGTHPRINVSETVWNTAGVSPIATARVGVKFTPRTWNE